MIIRSRWGVQLWGVAALGSKGGRGAAGDGACTAYGWALLHVRPQSSWQQREGVRWRRPSLSIPPTHAAHARFSAANSSTPPPTHNRQALQNTYRTFGAVPVSGTAFFKLLAAKEACLLYPGGVREGLKRKHEKWVRGVGVGGARGWAWWHA